MSEKEDKSYIILAVGVASWVLSFIFAIIDGIKIHYWKQNIHFAPDLSNHVWAFFLLGFYSTYRYVIENTQRKEGLCFPNAWKIVVSLILLGAVTAVSWAYLWGELYGGIGSDPMAFVDAIIKLIDYIRSITHT